MVDRIHEESIGKTISFLLVEDDQDHADLVMHSFSKNRMVNKIFHVRDGSEALDFLRNEGLYHSAKRPDVILLDLKLPKVDGHEVLQKIKSDPKLSLIPVVVLTTSSAELDRESAYREHANSYLIKPLDFGSFRKMVDDLNLYWSVWNQPPKAMW